MAFTARPRVELSLATKRFGPLARYPPRPAQGIHFDLIRVSRSIFLLEPPEC
jgi:hypothetical protein